MQVPEEVILFVKNESNSALRGKMVAKLIENPQATIDDLKKFYVVEKESWDISLAKLLKKYQEKGNLENYDLGDDLITSTVEEAKELHKNSGGQIKFESSFPTITLTVNDKVYIYDDTSIEKSIAKFLQKLHSLTSNIEWVTYLAATLSNSDAADIKTGIIEVIKCKTRQDLIKYGAGQKWCVCDPSNASHYITYKVNKNATFYMVFDGLKNDTDPAKKVLITIGKGNLPIEYADIRNERQIEGYKNLDEYYEYLEENGISRKQFVHDPMSDEDREIIEKVKNKNKSTEWFANLSSKEQTYYISMGYDLTNAQFNVVMSTDLPKSRNIILDAYVTAGKSLPFYQLNKLNNYDTDFIKSYKVSRETYLNRMKQQFENKPGQLIEFAWETFDRELLVELFKENKIEYFKAVEMLTKLFIEDDQFCVRFGLEFSEVANSINWRSVIHFKDKTNTIDDNFIDKYKEYFDENVWRRIVYYKIYENTLDKNFENKYIKNIKEILPKIDWINIVNAKSKNNTLDENFIKRFKKYLGYNTWVEIIHNKLLDDTLDENFKNKYKEKINEILPDFDWILLIGEKIENNSFDENFIDRFKQYFDRNVWYDIIYDMLVNNTLDEIFEIKYKDYYDQFLPEFNWEYITYDKIENHSLDEKFIDRYGQYFDESVWRKIATEKLYRNTLDEKFIDQYGQYFNDNVWSKIISKKLSENTLDKKFIEKYGKYYDFQGLRIVQEYFANLEKRSQS